MRVPRPGSYMGTHAKDMHYHCDACGTVSPNPGKCRKEGCELFGEQMELCRKPGCSPEE